MYATTTPGNAGVGDGVADERDAAQHHVRAHDGAHDAHEREREQRPDEERRSPSGLEQQVHQRPPLLVEVALAGRGVVVVVGVVEHHGASLDDEQVPAVGRRQDVRVQHEVGRAVGDDRAVHRQHLLEALGGAGEVVGRGDDRLAAGRLGLEEVHQQLLGGGVDAGHRLVQQEQVRLGGERPGEEHAPSLAAGRGARSASAGGRPSAPAPGRPWTARRSSAPGAAHASEAREAAHHHDVLDRDREGPVHELRLRARRRRAAPRGRRGRRGPGSGPTTDATRPAISLSSVLLPAPLGPTTARRLPGLHRDRHVLQRDPLAVAGGDVAQPDVRVRERVGRVQRAVIVVVVAAARAYRGRMRRTGGGDGGGLHMRHSII